MIQRIARRALQDVRRRIERPFEALEPRRLRAAAAQEVVFQDVGVGGTQDFHVSTPLYASVAPFGNSADVDNPDTYDEVYNETFGPLRTQIAIEPADEALGALDIVGTPVMDGKVVVMDARPLNAENPEDLGTMKTYLYDPGTPFNAGDDQENPGVPPTNLHVDLSYGSFARFTDVIPAGAPGPTLRHNPFIGPNPVRQIDPSLPADDTPGVTIVQGGRSVTGSFLLDTGAVASMVSQHTAEAVGVSYAEGTYGTEEARLVDASGNDVPGQFTLTIGGIGGARKMAGFFADSMTLPTVEGAPVRYVRAPFLVSDITVADPRTGQELTLDGIFGMNALVASAFINENDPFPFPTDVTAGPYDWIVFDEPAGVLGLAVPGVTPARGTTVDVEGVQPLALDQPRVNVLLRRTADGEPLTVGEAGFDSFNIQAFLDTGASGVLLSKETAEALGVENSTFAVPEGVVGRHLFYNNSAFDGRSAAANADDDRAIATDKAALLPGDAATFADVSSYAKGINGVMVDVAGLPAGRTVSAADFDFKLVDPNSTTGYRAAPAPSGVSVRRGAGEGGTDRVTITWPDGAIKNNWLSVQVYANQNTGLAAADVFSFGNLIGETGNAPAAGAPLAVNALDLAAVKRALNSASAVSGAFDFDRSGTVNALDLAAVRANLNRTLRLAGVGSPPALIAEPAAVFPSAAALPATREPSNITAMLRTQSPPL